MAIGRFAGKKSLKKQMWQLLQLQIIDQLYLVRAKKKGKRKRKKKKND